MHDSAQGADDPQLLHFATNYKRQAHGGLPRGLTMDVILSWSGDQSRKVAEALTDWLKDVLPGIKPWISTEDITKGSAWFLALLGRLEAARFCIICITPAPCVRVVVASPDELRRG